MGKALKWLVVVLLLLSIVSLVLGVMLFSRREVLKGRTQKHEQAIVNIASKLHFEGLDPKVLQDYAQMQGALDQVTVAADNTYEDLQNTKKDLENTRTELAQTKTELDSTKNQLADAQNKVTELTADLEQKEAELTMAKGRIDQLEQDKTMLQSQIDGLNNQLVKADEEIRGLQEKVTMLDDIIKKEDMRQGRLGTGVVPVGTTGKVVVVNPDWNFVVLDIGSDSGLVPNAEMMVHRGDQLVGKVRVSSVEKGMAVAEIMNDWTQQPLEEGDHVLY